MFTWDELRTTLHVEQLDRYLFRGNSISLGLQRVFGGQVLAQSLNSAYRSVDEGKVPHSLHAYFLRPGDFNRPIIYEVDPIRTGRSFSTRRVVARQNGEAIFNASVSFHKIEDGPSHQMTLPDHVKAPDTLLSQADNVEQIAANLPDAVAERLRKSYLTFPSDVIDLRTDIRADMFAADQDLPEQGYWFRFVPDVGDDPVMHMTLLAYISDKGLLMTGTLPHAAEILGKKTMGASLDHAMWFHDDINVSTWTYYHLDSPRSGRARNFNRGSFFDLDGRLVASSAQEGLFRIIRDN